MRKVILLVMLAFNSLCGFTQKGTVKESLGFMSTILDDTVKYSIVLPPDYETSGKPYPVVYLLHGYTNNETTWIRKGKIREIVKDGLEKGEITSLILIMPDGSDTRYCNDYKNKRRWRDMFIEEFIPQLEKKYRIKPERAFRAIAGQSMGGYGALMLAMKHPDVFSYCVALGAALYSNEDIIARPAEKYKKYWKIIYGGNAEGKSRITANWRSHDPLELVHTVPASKLKTIRFYIDCGDDDLRTKGNSLLHLKMLEKEVPHEYRVRQGGHDWQYWRTGIYEGLKFITTSLADYDKKVNTEH